MLFSWTNKQPRKNWKVKEKCEDNWRMWELVKSDIHISHLPNTRCVQIEHRCPQKFVQYSTSFVNIHLRVLSPSNIVIGNEHLQNKLGVERDGGHPHHIDENDTKPNGMMKIVARFARTLFLVCGVNLWGLPTKIGPLLHDILGWARNIWVLFIFGILTFFSLSSYATLTILQPINLNNLLEWYENHVTSKRKPHVAWPLLLVVIKVFMFLCFFNVFFGHKLFINYKQTQNTTNPGKPVQSK